MATGGYGMVWYGKCRFRLYSAIVTKVSNALNTLVPREKPGFQALSKGLIVLLCAEVVRQRVPDHGGRQWIADVVAPPSVAVWRTWDAACRQHRWPTPVCNNQQGTAEPCHADICARRHWVYKLLHLPHRASMGCVYQYRLSWLDRLYYRVPLP